RYRCAADDGGHRRRAAGADRRTDRGIDAPRQGRRARAQTESRADAASAAACQEKRSGRQQQAEAETEEALTQEYQETSPRRARTARRRIRSDRRRLAMAVSANKLELLQIADAVAREKSIDRGIVIAAMEDAIAKAARARYGSETDVHAEIDAKK